MDDSRWTVYTRDARRYLLPGGSGAWIELGWPPGSRDRSRFRLVDLCWGGASFDLPVDLGSIAEGVGLTDAAVGFGGTVVEGTLDVRHVTRDAAGLRCGGRFVPASPRDETALDGILSRLEHLTHDGMWALV